MKTLLLALLIVPALALGAEKAAGEGGNPMAGWVPPKVKREAKDKQEIQGLLKAMEAAGRTGDLDAAAALVDFPVTMMTDDSKGEGMGEAWDREKWTQVMAPFYAKPTKDMKVTHKPSTFLLSDSLAVVEDVCTMTQGGKTMTTRTSMFLVRKDGTWRVKSMAEGGWGDTMGPGAQGTAASGAQGPASQGTGSGAAEPAPAPAPGAGAPAPGAGAPAPTERTTK